MNWKKFFMLGVIVSTISTATLTADIGHSSTSTYSGIITAVEDSRDSFTVEAADGTVKMFQVSPSRKKSLTVGSKVTVTYKDAYEWPLATTSISGGGYMK
ncbi:MAG: hypothetical protein ACFCUX_02265 [Candidatus Methylacidiphilales bacterium]